MSTYVFPPILELLQVALIVQLYNYLAFYEATCSKRISSYASDLTQDTNWPVMFLTQFFDSLLFEESFASRLRISITFFE